MAKKRVQKPDLEKLTFEQAIEALTSIVDNIETGQVPLQESLDQYEKGMALIAHCREILQTAEKKIEEIDIKNSDSDQDKTDKQSSQIDDEDPDEGLF